TLVVQFRRVGTEEHSAPPESGRLLPFDVTPRPATPHSTPLRPTRNGLPRRGMVCRSLVPSSAPVGAVGDEKRRSPCRTTHPPGAPAHPVRISCTTRPEHRFRRATASRD